MMAIMIEDPPISSESKAPKKLTQRTGDPQCCDVRDPAGQAGHGGQRAGQALSTGPQVYVCVSLSTKAHAVTVYYSFVADIIKEIRELNSTVYLTP
jgi:hypothetical protein